MNFKPYQLLVLSSLIFASLHGEEAVIQPETPAAPAANVAPVAPVEMAEEEIIELIGYLTAQGGGVASLQLEKESIIALAEGVQKGLSGELNLMEMPEAEVEAAFVEAQARAEAVQAENSEESSNSTAYSRLEPCAARQG